MMLLRNKLLLPKIGEPRQKRKTGLLEVVVVVTPIGAPTLAVTLIGVPKLVVMTGPPLPPSPIRTSGSLPSQTGPNAVPGTAKRKSRITR